MELRSSGLQVAGGWPTGVVPTGVGLGGYQTQPFVLHPVELSVNGDEPLVGAAAVHHLMKGWVANPNGRPESDAERDQTVLHES